VARIHEVPRELPGVALPGRHGLRVGPQPPASLTALHQVGINAGEERTKRGAVPPPADLAADLLEGLLSDPRQERRTSPPGSHRAPEREPDDVNEVCGKVAVLVPSSHPTIRLTQCTTVVAVAFERHDR